MLRLTPAFDHPSKTGTDSCNPQCIVRCSQDESSQNSGNFPDQFRNLIFLYFPKNLKVDSKILVNDAVTKSPDSEPIDRVVFFTKIIRQHVRSFPNDLEITANGIDELVIVIKIFKRHSVRVIQNFFWRHQACPPATDWGFF
jgi:hypothetical protein